MSERSFSRRYMPRRRGMTPARAVERLRVEGARRLLSDTPPARQARLAARCGFGSEETLRRSFRAPARRHAAGVSGALRVVTVMLLPAKPGGWLTRAFRLGCTATGAALRTSWKETMLMVVMAKTARRPFSSLIARGVPRGLALLLASVVLLASLAAPAAARRVRGRRPTMSRRGCSARSTGPATSRRCPPESS